MQNRLFKILTSLVLTTLLLSSCSGEEKRILLIDTYIPNDFKIECLDLSLQSLDTVKVSEGFTGTVKLTNTCDKTITVESGAGGDLLITQADGEVLWQNDQGYPTLTWARSSTLASGESFEWGIYTWNGKDWQNKTLAVGDYQAVVMVNIINIELQSSGNLESVKSFKITN